MGDAKRTPSSNIKRVYRALVDVIALLVVVALFVFVLTPGETGGAGSASGAVGTEPDAAPDEAAPEEAAPSAGEGDGKADGDAGIAPGRIREHILEHGTAGTGAFNLVTAIYLGYRAFDTLGETIVLLLAVSGVAYFVGAKR